MSQQRKVHNRPRVTLRETWTKRSLSQPPPLYSSLDSQAAQIRVLGILPGRWDEQLSGVLRVVSLNDKPMYEAISYTWGLSTENNTIKINNTHDVKITDNLFRALKRLRQQIGKRTLWIDALCIDQNNKEERAQQVSLMGVVYRQAKAVLVWLGEYPNPSALDPWRMRRPHLKTKKGSVLLNSRGREFTIAMDNAIKYSRPRWPDRGWIVQEFVLAKQIVLCFGPISIDYDVSHIIDLLMVSKRPLPHLRTFHERTTDMARLRYGLGKRRQSIAEAALHTSNAWCTERHDKVYSLLSLIDENEAKLIGCDYDRPSAETFAIATFAALTIQNNFRIWELVNCNDRINADVPSWAVDFDVVQYPSECRVHELIEQSVQWPMSASQHAQPGDIDSSRKLLTVFGAILDRVSDLLVMPTTDMYQLAGEFEQDLAHFLEKVCREHDQDISAHVGPQLLLRSEYDTVYVSTVLKAACDLWDEVIRQSPRDQSSTNLSSWMRDQQEIQQYTRQKSTSNLYQFLTYAEFAGKGCSVLVTAEGYLGWAPCTIEAGDLIALIRGSKLPVALRRVHQQYTFQGLVYIQNVMEDQLIHAWKGRDIAEMEFVLS